MPQEDTMIRVKKTSYYLEEDGCNISYTPKIINYNM